MEIKDLILIERKAEEMLENALMEYVSEHGSVCTDNEVEAFGLEEEGYVTKVLNFYDNGGCYFFEPDKPNMDGLDDMDEGNYYDKLYENVVYTAYQCLYIVVDENGIEHLKYYRFTNGGVTFDDDQSEPDHDEIKQLSLIDMHYLIHAIIQTKW